ncbi:MAG TPA: hypothetical protein P5205_02635 [Candidatus Paceibacterota bacterium]|nr:hypothetical protein [Verrucomicrobiota bacterium]HSA09244.1 hypothetical protein [Candidatus Paceibacterota bacterium]
MSAHTHSGHLPPLDLSRWRKAPGWLIGGGLAVCALGAVLDLKQFGYSWLLAFMFWLSLVMGAAFLVMVHHLFDASWSVGIRRFCEHLACLVFPWMAIFFLPVAALALKIYPWMSIDSAHDHELAAKWPLFTRPAFYLAAVVCFGVWALFTRKLRSWSLKQDADGSAQCTHRLRFHSSWGMAAFAFTLTLGVIMWMKGLQHQWFSTMYGVYYFAGAVWVAIAAAYVIALILDRQGLIRDAMGPEQYYYLGSLLFAFTVFSAYIHFSQYFIIWNANLAEETFWYVLREKGTWWTVGLILVFGHFLVPFLCLLRIDAKLVFRFMAPLCVWIGLMQYVDLSFNIMPVLHPDGFAFRWIWLDAGCLALMGGVLARVFLRDLNRHAPYPVKDPRLAEAMGLYPDLPGALLEEEPGSTDKLSGAQPQSAGGGQ